MKIFYVLEGKVVTRKEFYDEVKLTKRCKATMEEKLASHMVESCDDIVLSCNRKKDDSEEITQIKCYNNTVKISDFACVPKENGKKRLVKINHTRLIDRKSCSVRCFIKEKFIPAKNGENIDIIDYLNEYTKTIATRKNLEKMTPDESLDPREKILQSIFQIVRNSKHHTVNKIYSWTKFTEYVKTQTNQSSRNKIINRPNTDQYFIFNKDEDLQILLSLRMFDDIDTANEQFRRHNIPIELFKKSDDIYFVDGKLFVFDIYTFGSTFGINIANFIKFDRNIFIVDDRKITIFNLLDNFIIETEIRDEDGNTISSDNVTSIYHHDHESFKSSLRSMNVDALSSPVLSFLTNTILKMEE